jgi:hypothetical protein
MRRFVMFQLRYGVAPALALACLGSAICALGLSGCAGSEAAPTPTPAGRFALEPDGLPSQVHPPAYIRTLPDDPSEPFSANYGAPMPASYIGGLAAHHLSPAEEEAIIAAAIAAHEMRNP